jgi:WD40 repeat protein
MEGRNRGRREKNYISIDTLEGKNKSSWLDEQLLISSSTVKPSMSCDGPPKVASNTSIETIERLTNYLHVGEMIATAGDDANAIIWVPNDLHNATATFGEDGLEDKESWRPKHMNRQGGSDIYDLAWSPDGNFFITGSMDNVARIYDAHTGN